jgi:UDP-N-acetylglucosamine 2-epimerase
MYYIKTSEKCFESQKVNLVAGIDDLIAVTRAVILSAKQRGIPTLVIQNGFTGMPSGQGYLPLSADKIAVWGKKSRDWLISKGINPKKIAITGNPQICKISYNKVSNKFYNDFKLDKKKKTVLLATQAFGDMISERESSELVKSTILALPKDKQMVIKIHPREKTELYDSIIKETNARNVFIMKENLKELINICEVLVTINSAVALDALCINKPVIIADFFKRNFEVPYVGSGVTINAKNKEHLALLLNNVKRNKINKNMINSIIDTSGNASEKIISLIQKMTSSSPRRVRFPSWRKKNLAWKNSKKYKIIK